MVPDSPFRLLLSAPRWESRGLAALTTQIQKSCEVINLTAERWLRTLDSATSGRCKTGLLLSCQDTSPPLGLPIETAKVLTFASRME
jgi:hypothetical protein